MATLGKRGDRWFVQFPNPDTGKRVTVSLLTKSQRQATAGKLAIENLLSSVRNGFQLDPATSAWLATVKPVIRCKLEDACLVESEQPREDVSLERFLDDYEKRRTDIKPNTRLNWQRTIKNLKEHLDAGKAVSEITAADAADFRRKLITHGLAPATVGKQIQQAKTFFSDAVDRGIIDENPFAKLKTSSGRGDRSRDFFITVDMTAKVLEACPDAEWQAIVALARYGGLRCPSEVLLLTWADIDWDRSRIRVRSPKTERHEGKSERMIPLFPELVPMLSELFNQRGVGVQVPSSSPVITRYAGPGDNLRTTLGRIIKRAGLVNWPKLFQNLRASRATELVARFPSHVATAWLGHSEKIARDHYWQVTDDDFNIAIGERCKNVDTDAVLSAASDQPTNKKPAVTCDEVHTNAGGVAETGVEPAHLAVPDPKSGASANSATRPISVVIVVILGRLCTATVSPNFNNQIDRQCWVHSGSAATICLLTGRWFCLILGPLPEADRLFCRWHRVSRRRPLLPGRWRRQIRP